MAAENVAQVPQKLYAILEPLTPDERIRVVRATLILLGDEPADLGGPGAPAGTAQAGQLGNPPTDAGAFFDLKDPKNKGEALAVAARYREQHLNQESHTKADLKAVITDARRNFDDSNFSRDINNAKRQAGFFNLNTGRDASKLSYYGQQFVDALPDRDAAGQLKRPKVGSGKRRSSKQKNGS